jgi:EF hand
MNPRRLSIAPLVAAALLFAVAVSHTTAQKVDPVDVEGQPLAGNVKRVLQALQFLGAPLADDPVRSLQRSVDAQDARLIQQVLDPRILFVVTINPESRVKVKRGPATAALQQGGYTPVIVKVINEGGVTKPLHIASSQALPTSSRGKPGEITDKDVKDRFLDIEMSRAQPLTDKLSGLKVEYAVALIHSTQSGKREAIISFDVGQGTQDIGFRGEVPVLFDIRPATPVKLVISDFDGTPTTGRFTFQDKLGRIYPPKAKRIAPDFFFQDQVYRHSGGTVLLPPGDLTMIYGRGPEYRQIAQQIKVPDKGEAVLKVKLERWINPMDYGFYSGDHHIHAAGCAHYTNPTEGVFGDDMFLHVKGEALNVGCNLTWGPCFDFQRQFFTAGPHKLSEPFTVLRYDIEVSGFGSQALGHVCLLNLRDQDYPGSDGTKTKGWPTWTTPLMKWAKQQGAYTGYAHSASGLTFDAKGVGAQDLARRTIAQLDANKDGEISVSEAAKGLLPADFARLDTNGDGFVTADEIVAYVKRSWNNELPNYIVPPMDGIGAQEICVTTAQGLCDFISAMDTARVPEWNCWYHIMNCGFPLKASGETDFPCITGSRVGQGRVYVQLGKVDKVDYAAWCEGIAKGRSYVSDGYAHALSCKVGDKAPGDKLKLAKGGMVKVEATVAFGKDAALGTAQGGTIPNSPTRLVELIVNGQVAAKQQVAADDKEHTVSFNVPIAHSSWVALRQFPQMHTNPVDVLVGDQPIRASRKSALWCIGTIEQLWRVRNSAIAPNERAEAQKTFQAAIERYRKLAAECPEGS